MTPLRGLGQDLIDKRLWPIALVLVVAIIAAPTVLARGGSGDDAAVSTPVVQPEGLRAAVVETAEPGAGPTSGSLRNPFFNPPDEETAGTAQPAEGATTSPTNTGSAAPEGEPTTVSTTTGDSEESSDDTDSSSGTGEDPEPTKTTSKKGSGETGYDLSLRFGIATEDGELTAMKDVPRLTPLPTTEEPLFVYMGVLSGGKTAVFLLGDGIAGSEGDGVCRPSPTQCETLELKKGETQFLEGAPAPVAEGQTTPPEPGPQYQLDVVSLTKRGSGKATGASKSRGKKAAKKAAKTAKAGRSEVRKARKRGASATLDRYRYDAASGVIRRLTLKQRARARASASAGLRVRRTGTVIASGALPG